MPDAPAKAGHDRARRDSSFPRHALPESCKPSPSKTERAQGKPGAPNAPAASRPNEKRTRVSHHRSAVTSGLPRAMVLRLLRALPGVHDILVTVVRKLVACDLDASPGAQLAPAFRSSCTLAASTFTSRKAKGASKINISSAAFDLKFQLRTRGHSAGTSNRRHWHHTTSPSARRRSSARDKPARSTPQSVHCIPRPRFVTIGRSAPLCRAGRTYENHNFRKNASGYFGHEAGASPR